MADVCPINDVNVCLIKKKEKTNKMSQFQPIRFHNVSYKISNILCHKICQRLKKVLAEQISETKSAFFTGWHISDNVLIV